MNDDPVTASSAAPPPGPAGPAWEQRFRAPSVTFYTPYKSDPDRWKNVLAGFKSGV